MLGVGCFTLGSRRGWICGCFPLTPALSLGERENRPRRGKQARTFTLPTPEAVLFPLPEGEGQGEGERTGAQSQPLLAFGKERSHA